MPQNAERSVQTTLSGNRRRRLFQIALFGIATLIALLIAGGEALADPASPITVTKTASSNPIASGAQLTYTIVAKNTAGGSISNVVLSDQVNGLGVVQSPPALPQLIITSTKGSCSQGGANGNLVTCAVGTMAGGESFTVTIRGQVTAGAGTTLNNTASVTGTKSAQNFTTQSNTVAVLVTQGAGGQSDLSINKTGPTSVPPSSPMTYTLTVNNTGTANATSVKVVDTLPPGVALVSTSTTSLFTCSPAGPAAPPVTVTCTGGAVNAGQNGTITINATSPSASGQITNTAVVDPDNTISETNELNNTSAAVNTAVGTTPPPTPLLTIQKTDGTPSLGAAWATGAGPDPVNPGQKLTYKIQVVNTATGNNATANDVVVTDNTQGLDAASIVASQTIVGGQLAKTDGCVVVAPQVKCTIKALSGGSVGTQTITISGTVQQSAGSSIFNTATVTGNVKNTGVSNTASEVTTIRPAVDLTITKDDSPDPVCARSWPNSSPNQHLPQSPTTPLASGTPTALLNAPSPAPCLGGLTYSLVVGNSGIATAANVEVRDPLPPGLIFDSYQNTDGGGFTCSLLAGNVVDCTGGSIPAASVKHLNLLFTAPPTVGSITNTVYVDPNNAIFEPDETNNTATQTTAVNTGVDLVVWKNDAKGDNPPGSGAPNLDEGFDPIATNGTGTYTVIVDNVGPQDTTDIKLVDTLPAGTRFLSVTSDSGFTCSHNGAATGGDVTCVGGHLIGTESEFYSPAGYLGLLPGDQWATIKIKFFATKFVQPAMHNIVRVDPDNTIPEINELNNTAVDDTKVIAGNDNVGAFNQLTIAKAQTSPTGTVATNATLKYELTVSNLGTDPVSNVVVKDFLPTGARFISAADSTGSGPASAAFFCIHDGSASGGVVTCTGGDFDGSLNTIPVGNITRKITVTVFAPATPGTYVNHATVDPDDIVPEGNEFDNDAQVTTTVGPCVGASECTNENAFYELTIDKTQVSPANPVARNGIVTYNLKVSNLGSDSVHGVVATDRLPAGFRFIDAKDSAGPGDPNAFTCAGPDGSGVVTCSGGSLSGTVNALAGGAPTFRTIIVRVFAPDEPGTYSNLAFVDPNNTIPEGNEFNNQASLDTTVTNGGNGAYIDLKVEKTRTFPDPTTDQTVSPGGGIQYKLHVTNGGAGDAFNVAVVDALPQHVTFHNARDAAPNTAGAFSCAFNSGTLTCTGGTITAGGSRDILVNVTVDSKIDGSALDPADVHILITNQAIVDPNNAIPEGDETNNTSSVDTTIKPPLDLTLEKDGPGSASPNENTTYTITVHNVTKVTPGATASNVMVVDPLPTGLIPLNVEATGDFHCDLQENPVNKVTCIGDLQAGTDATITITAFVTLQSGTLDNEACVDPNDTIAETDETNNCKTTFATVETPTPDIQINKTADSTTVTAGQKLNYTLNVSNVGTGPTDGSDVVVTDNVPSDVTVDQVQTPTGWDCSATSGNNVSCKTSLMNAGDSASIVINTTVGNSLTAPFTNVADVSGGGDNQSNNNEDSVKTLVGTASAIDLHVVSLTGTPDPVNHDNTLTYTAVVTNDGTNDSGPNRIVRVTLPASGVSNLAVVATGGFSCGVTTGSVFDCVVDLAAGGSTTITATMKVDSTAPPPASLSATVTADPDDLVVESDETNNTQTTTVTVSGTVCGGSPCIDLFATMTGTPIAGPGPFPVTYTATITNTGTTPLGDSPVWTADFSFIGLASGLSVAPAGPGVTCTPFGLDVLCKGTSPGGDAMELAPGASLTFLVNAIDLTPSPPGGVLQMLVNADSTNAVSELNEGNNTALVVTGTP